MGNESEGKFKVAGLTAARGAMRKLGATLLGSVLQTDTYYDRPDGSLRKADCGLRLRRLKNIQKRGPKEDLRAVLTYKGPRRPRSRIKIRREVETRVDEADAVAEMLEAVGFVESMVIQKRRTSFRLGRLRIELDELPRLGTFVEVEGPDEERILRFWRKLGLAGEPITASYTRLAADFLHDQGSGRRELTFGSPR